MSVTFDELKDTPLEPHVAAVYNDIMSMDRLDLRHLLVKLMGKDAMQLDIVGRAVSGELKLKISD